MSALDTQLKEIAALESEKTLLEDSIKAKRDKVVKLLQKENLKNYKNDSASVVVAEKKQLAYKDRSAIIKSLEESNRTEYIEIIPEKKELNKMFEDAIKNGNLKMDGVEVLTTEFLQIRFAK